MKDLTCKITGFRKAGNKKIFTLDHKFEDLFPGQLFLAFNPKKNAHLMSVNIFSIRETVWFVYDEEYLWEIGDDLIIHGPIGEGFRSILRYQNLLLIDLESENRSLYSLMEAGLNEGKNIVYSAKETEFPIPASVEIIPNSLTGETLFWADFIAVEVNREKLSLYEDLFIQIMNMNIDCDVMVHCPILCYGKSDCMVCTIKSKNGWVKTCQQGQVIKLDQLVIE